MNLGTRVATVSLVAIALVSATSPGALAERTEVQTPVGTYYLVEDHDIDDPFTDDPLICETPAGGFELCPRIGLDAAEGSSAQAGVWVETNGCDGLQREPVDCDLDRAVEPADETLFSLGL